MLSIFHNILFYLSIPCFIASVEVCGLAYTLHWVAYISTENHCQDYGTQIEVGWHDLFIAMVKAKPSKTSDRQAELQFSSLVIFLCAPGLRTLIQCDRVFFVLAWTLGYSSAGHASLQSLHRFAFRVDMAIFFLCEVSCHIVFAPINTSLEQAFHDLLWDRSLAFFFCGLVHVLLGHVVYGEF